MAKASSKESLQRARDLADAREHRNRSARALLEYRALKAVGSKLEKVLAGNDRPARGPMAMGGSYENSTRNRMRSTTPRPKGGAAWIHLDKATRDGLRRDTQHLKRNNLTARALINSHADFIVGDGAVVKPTAKIGDPAQAAEWNADVKQKFDAWAMGTDPMLGKPSVRGLSTLWEDLKAVADAWCTDGDRLACAVTDAEGRITIQYHTAETIVNAGGRYQDTETMISGVEFEQGTHGGGRCVAFHVAGYEKSGTTLRQGTWRLPAETCCFLPNPTGYDPEQIRGEPALQAALDWLDLIDGYIEDHAMAAQIQTWIGAIFKSEKPADLQAQIVAATANQPSTTNASSTAKTLEMGPAFSYFCKPGESVEAFQPQFPVQGFKDYVFTLIQIVGADVGLPLAIFLFLSDGLNFSNLRGVISMAMRRMTPKQAKIAGCTSWIYRLKVQEWIAKGIVPARDDWDSHTVTMPPAPVVDFKMESEGYAFAVEKNLMPKGTAIERLGFGTFEDVATERQREVETETEKGITPPSTPGSNSPGAPRSMQAVKQTQGSETDDQTAGATPAKATP